MNTTTANNHFLATCQLQNDQINKREHGSDWLRQYPQILQIVDCQRLTTNMRTVILRVNATFLSGYANQPTS